MKRIKSFLSVLLVLCLFFSGCVVNDTAGRATEPSSAAGQTEAPAETGREETDPTVGTTEQTVPEATSQTEPETTAPHQHDYLAATCIEPKTCASCGEIEGDPLGHDWKDAGCDTPKTCSRCAQTEGVAAGHSWKDATCEDPRKCVSCGKTEGSAAGHSWKAATCTAPKTCSVCKEETGSTAEHTYKSGKCASCGISDPSYSDGPMVWIPTKGGTKYHSRSDCSNMTDPDYVTLSQAVALGFTACKRCH